MSSRDKKLLPLAIFLFLLSIAILCWYFFFCGKERSGSENRNQAAEQFKYFSQLTGLGVRTEAEVAPAVIAVMVDNHPEAMPISGLNEAAIIYEAPVEGAFTRFMAIYPAMATAEKVGPVRSVRPYYLDWLAEYGDGLYMHCGGSAEGLAALKARKIFDANEFFRGPYFWREPGRTAPHNLYTSAEKWQKYLVDYGPSRASSSPWSGWLFSDKILDNASEAVGFIKIKYGAGFVVGWKYNPETKNYERYFNEEKFLDDQGRPVVANNIIIQYVPVKVLDEIGRLQIDTIGDGGARVLRDGKMTRGVWRKAGLTSRTRFYDSAGQEISLQPGRVWVLLVPEKAEVEIGT